MNVERLIERLQNRAAMILGGPAQMTKTLEEAAAALAKLQADNKAWEVALNSERELWNTISDQLEASVAKLQAENSELRLAICGGEDAPGYADSLPHEAILGVLRDNYQSWKRDSELAWDGETADTWKSRAAKLQAERDEAREALRPFAEASRDCDDDLVSDGCSAWESSEANCVTIGHFRAASRALGGGQ